MKEMSYQEFEEKFMKPKKQWQFDLFSIVCKKCSSDKVEFNGNLEEEAGYYGESYITGQVVVKCHGCGNAFTMDKYDLEPIE